jgi:VWFA-related protein
MSRIAIVGSAWLALWTGVQDRPTFRSEAHTVYVYATVQGQDGRLITNLTREDFEILDNNRLQPITVFDNSPQTITLAVMLDMSRSMAGDYARIRAGAESLVRALWPDDRARMGSFGQEVAISPLLTSDKPTLLRILDEELWLGTATPLWHATEVAMASLDKEPGRRVVLMFTDGNDSGLFVPGSLRQVRTIAENGGFMIYAVGLEGHGLTEEMRSLVDESGGGRYVVRRQDDLGETFEKVVDELHHQYVIGFPMAAADGRTHKLTLRTKVSGLKVRGRKSYVARIDTGAVR